MLAVQMSHGGARPPTALRHCMRPSFTLPLFAAAPRCERCGTGQAAAEERAAAGWRLRAWYNRTRMRRRRNRRPPAASTPPPRLRPRHQMCPHHLPADCHLMPATRSLCAPRRCSVGGFWPANGRAAPTPPPRSHLAVAVPPLCRRRRAAAPSSPTPVPLQFLRNRRVGRACVGARATPATRCRCRLRVHVAASVGCAGVRQYQYRCRRVRVRVMIVRREKREVGVKNER